ncbi:MAG TPA: carboxymuconolactone decarboxylase family protein [Pseudolabrys sp.]|jgi:alkylhydroperoxidase/carboxymuconolactone decarboxylase family protein YurZ|nr:carboxymuconolactone decarboxylase family protein [Pseudolabrys sp.]
MPRSEIDFNAVRAIVGNYADKHTSSADRGQPYTELIGFVPPRVGARLAVTGALDPELLRMQEEIRLHAMFPACFDTKTSQLMLFGMLLLRLMDAASLHGRAARRAGATWEEMQAVVSLAYLFGGMPIANRGAEIIAQLAEAEGHESCSRSTNGK